MSRRGNQRENKVMAILVAAGWFAMCGRASRGPADVLAVRYGYPPLLVQVKSTAGGPYERFLPSDRRELIEAAQMAGGAAWLAWWPPRVRSPRWLSAYEWPGGLTMTDGSTLAWTPADLHAGSGVMKLELCPVELREANAYVDRHHRHSTTVVRDKFRVGLRNSSTGDLVGVAQVGRPRARMLQDGSTVEILRVCTSGERNACSALYAACCRAARALGYRRVVTYTLAEEDGASLKASGFTAAHETAGQHWSRPSRPRDVEHHEIANRVRWERHFPVAALTSGEAIAPLEVAMANAERTLAEARSVLSGGET